MECWNVGILGVRVEINHFNCKKLLQTHYSITPSFHYSNWGEPLSSFDTRFYSESSVVVFSPVSGETSGSKPVSEIYICSSNSRQRLNCSSADPVSSYC